MRVWCFVADTSCVLLPLLFYCDAVWLQLSVRFLQFLILLSAIKPPSFRFSLEEFIIWVYVLPNRVQRVHSYSPFVLFYSWCL